MKKYSALPYWLITIGVMTVLILPKLIQDGMFMDAMLYTNVAKNLANDLGSFWNPHFDDFWNREGRSSFHEQPPLVFFLLSKFFKLFGDSMYTERIYVAVTTGLSAFLIHRIWKLIPGISDTLRKNSWLPVLIWITFPVVMWSHQQMLCENTMELFVLGSVFYMLRGIHFQKKFWVSMFFAGVCIFLASFSKGVPGFFPIVIFPLFWLVFKQTGFTKALLASFVIVLVPFGIYGLLFLDPDAAESLSFYVEHRLFKRISDDPVVADRFQVMKELATHLLLVMGVIGLIFGAMKIAKKRLPKIDKMAVLFFFLVGLAGSLPLTLTLVQRGFYMTPAMPFFAISLALILGGVIPSLGPNKKIAKIISGVGITIIGVGVVLTILNVGKVQRDHKKIELARLITEHIPAGSSVELSRHLYQDHQLECYMNRYGSISTSKKAGIGEYYLSISQDDVRPGCKPIKIGSYFLCKEP